MAIEIKAPVFPESVADGTIVSWHKKAGEMCSRDDLLADVETDKVVLEVVALSDGVLENILKDVGDTVESGETIGILNENATAPIDKPEGDSVAPSLEKNEPTVEKIIQQSGHSENILSPAAKKAVHELNVDLNNISSGTGKDGRIIKEDVIKAAAEKTRSEVPETTVNVNSTALAPVEKKLTEQSSSFQQGSLGYREEKRVPMTRLRAKVAQRLVQAQQSAAMLTTFNEVDMQPVMQLRARTKSAFEERHGVRLGFMSFFVKACVEALRRQPEVNASIDGNDIVYHGYQDIGVAVSSNRGLVVPVLRNAEDMNFAEIESSIRQFGEKAKSGKLSIDEISGGTFTISNGGVFGSLLSTPILNPPQSAILGMHKIQERAVVVDGNVVVKPMMYLALSYDHRLLDGKEAVTFLITIKELIEDPTKILLDI